MGPEEVLALLAELKKIQPAEVYTDLVRTFSEQPANAKYRVKGQSSFQDLLWLASSLSSTTLEKEFRFSVFWLKDSVNFLNNFRITASDIECLLLSNKPKEAYNLLIEHIRFCGWSMWAAELEFAFSSYFSDELKDSIKPKGYSHQGDKRISSLLGQVLKDRNDPSIPVGRFMEKCQNSFPKLKLTKSLKAYLFYRAYRYTGDIRETIPQFLSIEMGHSPIDYYETLIDNFSVISMDKEYSDLWPIVMQVTSELINIGYEDFRLKKINFLVGGEDFKIYDTRKCSPKTEEILEKILTINRLQDDVAANDWDILNLKATIDSFQASDSLGYDEANYLFKFGCNFRGLAVGAAIFGYISNLTEGNSGGSIVPAWGQFSSPNYRFNDFLSISQNQTSEVLHKVIDKFDESDLKNKCAEFVNWIDGNFLSTIQNDEDAVKLIWAAKMLISQSRTHEAFSMAIRIRKLGGRWTRYASNIEILASIENQDLDFAISSTCELLVEDERMTIQLPLDSLFEEKKWKDYKAVDPKIVALVSAASYEMTNDLNSRFICQMACRAYLRSGQRESVVGAWENLDAYQKSLTIRFLTTIWTEDNLSMAGFLTTQEVQRDRIEVLQLLLQIDSGDALDDYAEEIKNLTFSETLLQGLKHIESSRIFVNEGAIARWAEKELQPDFDRWKKESAKDSSTKSLDDVVRQYLMGDSSAQTVLFRTESLSENNIILLILTERLLGKFLSDPSDGLNCYLSSRIRHGTLKGTLLGPLDEAGLLGMSDAEIEADWRVRIGEISKEFIPQLISHVKRFNVDIENITLRLINETVQIQTPTTPNGKIYASIGGSVNFTTFLSLARDSPFPVFISSCFELFWFLLAPSLNKLADEFRTNVKNDLQTQFEKLIASLRPIGDSAVTLTTSLRTVATATQAQCDVIANWFQSERALDKHVFSLAAAIEIATASTGRVYRTFPISSVINQNPEQIVPLTSLGLSAITDCLYVMLENAFKHSGLKAKVGPLEIGTILDSSNNILQISLRHPLSDARLEELINGGLTLIREAYINNASIESAASEGGSGFAKLARISKTVDTRQYPDPIAIDLNDSGILTVRVCIPLYSRGDAFDAYFS